MKKRVRNLMALTMVVASFATGAINAYAGDANITVYDGVTVSSDSAIGTYASDKSTYIKATGGKVKINDIDSIKISDDSYIDVIAVTGSKVILAGGCVVNVNDISTVEVSNGSVVGILARNGSTKISANGNCGADVTSVNTLDVIGKSGVGTVVDDRIRDIKARTR